MKQGQDSPDSNSSDVKETALSASLSTSDECDDVSEPLIDTALDGGAKENNKVASFPSTRQPQLRSHSLDEVSDCPEDDLNSSQALRELQTKVWTLETQLETAASNQMSLQGLLQQVYLQEWSYLELSKRQAEEEVISAQKVVGVLWHQFCCLHVPPFQPPAHFDITRQILCSKLCCFEVFKCSIDTLTFPCCI